MGYQTECTPTTGDYGADLVLDDGMDHRYAVQAKRYQGDVGIAAVQEVLGAMSYYACQIGVICTTAKLTRQATELATRDGRVIIVSRPVLLKLLEIYLSDVVILPLMSQD